MKRMQALVAGVVGAVAGGAVSNVSAQEGAPLLHRYEFASDARDSIGTVHGSMFGGATIESGALRTDGVSGFVEFPEKLVPTTGSFTVAMWFRTVEVAQPNSIFELLSQGCTGCPGFYIGREANGDWRNFHDYYTPVGTGVPYPPTGAWRHVAVTVNRAAQLSTLWVDGESVATLPAAPMTTGGSPTRLGRQFGPYGEYFNGFIDDVRVYGGALSGEAISELSGSYPPIPSDCNNDGVVDHGQCRDGSLPDYNGNNIPDCCEQGTTCVVGSYPIEWRLEDGGNGHWFGTTSQTGTWDEMRALAVARGGDLASLASLAENEFANRTRRSEDAPVGGGPWIGARKLTGQVWQWMDGTNWGFVNWAQGEPCCGDAGLYVHLYPNGQWNDHNQYQYACRALIEWSADCNADGIVDYGQILRGELADTNANGVPDTCESTLLVPSQYPTIQAAIDAVPANSQRTVQVAAGTYHESFSLNGKNILIRGAANNATILDGTGLPASIATFAGGEPATAGLENLVFRSGIVGSLIYKGALFKVGGAVYGRDSSAFIRNCRFENNRSDYGGAVYLIYSSLLVEGCVFTGNTGVSQGGGMMAFGSTGAIRNCVFTANQCGIAGSGGGSAFKAAEALFTGETVLLDGCTITGNTAGVNGSAVEYHEDVGLHLGKMRLVNCTITGNRSGTITPVGAGGLTVTGTMQSCIIDAGTTICDNLPREVQGPYLISGAPTICDCMADLSGDGVVNGGDLGLLLSAWGATLPTGVGDVDHDGVVNGADMALLLGSWGPCP